MLQLETTPSAAGTTSSSLESTTRLANEILSLFQAHFNIQAGKAPGGSGWGGTTAATTTSGSSSSNYNIQHLLLNHSDSSSSKVTVFLYFLSRLCPGLLPPARIFRDYWEPLLKPILISSRNMELLHLTSHIVKNSFVQDSISITIADEEAMHLELMLADYISLVMERDQQRHDRLLLNLSPETGAASSGLSANVIARLDTFESILVTIGFAIPKVSIKDFRGVCYAEICQITPIFSYHFFLSISSKLFLLY